MSASSSFGVRGRVIARELEIESREVRPARRRQWLWWVVAALLCFAFWNLSSAGYVHAKAVVAQKLIAKAWAEARETGAAQRPWPWADTRAIARLTVAGKDVELIVLEGASGRSLAFGPGHVSGTAVPGSHGNSVIVAHKDTHFAFLKDLSSEDEIVVEDTRGRTTRYRVRTMTVVDREETQVLDAADSPQLTLITCYPFEGVTPGTPLRYVVVADRVA